MISLISRMIEHMCWADLRIFQSLQKFDMVEGVRLFVHVVASEKIHLHRIRGLDPWPQDFWPSLTLSMCEVMMYENHRSYQHFLQTIEKGELSRKVRYRNSQGTVHYTRMDDLLIHVALHGQHHRGQIAKMISDAGGQPAVIDFIVFSREKSDAP